jgi:hypothetical protein
MFMARRGSCWLTVLIVSAVAGLASPCHAGVVIDTLSSWDGHTNVNSFGEGTSLTYGQTITVPAVASVLDSFTFKLLQGGGNPTTIQFFVMAWAGDRVTGPVLLQTPSVTLINSGFYENYTVSTGGLPLISGNQYVLFFTSFNDLDQNNDASSAAAHNYATDPYSGGRFVYNDGGSSVANLAAGAWDTNFLGAGDLAFRAEFSSVPEASAFVIVLLTGLSAALCSKRALLEI